MGYIHFVSELDRYGVKCERFTKRLDSARELAKKYGCTMGDFFMTIGTYDMVVMLEAPDDAAAARFSLALGRREACGPPR